MKLRKLITENTNIKIIPIHFNPPYKKSTIYNISFNQMNKILGMKPNMARSEDDKVKYGWSFKFNGNSMAIWDYKDSGEDDIFSAFGKESDLQTLFGEEHVYKDVPRKIPCFSMVI